MHIVGLLPQLCLQLQKEKDPILGFESPLLQQYQKACSISMNISHWCKEKGLDDLAFVFSTYSKGQIIIIEDLLNHVSPLLYLEWFPRHSTLA